MYMSQHIDNNNVSIHYYDSCNQSDSKLLPIIVCPGLSETADEYIDFLEAILPRRCIVLSFRGRGKSSTPKSGYNLEEHISDIESVVKHAGLESFHIFGYSRGVAYALGYAQKHENQIKSLIVGDYHPEHRAMPPGWDEDYINNYLIPYNRTENIRPEAVICIQRESAQISLENSLAIPLLMARGKLEESLISDIDVERYKTMVRQLTVKEYVQSGHNIKGTDKGLFYADIIHFINSVGLD